MTTWIYIHGAPPLGIKYANELTQEFRKLNPDTLIYYYTELDPVVEFKKFEQWIKCLEPKKFVFWAHCYGVVHAAYFQRHLPSLHIKSVALDPVPPDDFPAAAQRMKRVKPDVIVKYQPGELNLEKKDDVYVCHYLERYHHSLHKFKEVAQILADKFGWM